MISIALSWTTVTKLPKLEHDDEPQLAHWFVISCATRDRRPGFVRRLPFIARDHAGTDQLEPQGRQSHSSYPSSVQSLMGEVVGLGAAVRGFIGAADVGVRTGGGVGVAALAGAAGAARRPALHLAR